MTIKFGTGATRTGAQGGSPQRCIGFLITDNIVDSSCCEPAAQVSTTGICAEFPSPHVPLIVARWPRAPAWCIWVCLMAFASLRVENLDLHVCISGTRKSDSSHLCTFWVLNQGTIGVCVKSRWYVDHELGKQQLHDSLSKICISSPKVEASSTESSMASRE